MFSTKMDRKWIEICPQLLEHNAAVVVCCTAFLKVIEFAAADFWKQSITGFLTLLLRMNFLGEFQNAIVRKRKDIYVKCRQLVSNWSFGYRGYGRESEMLGGQKGAMYI